MLLLYDLFFCLKNQIADIIDLYRMYKKDGTYNDRYESVRNNIPYCFEDFQELYLVITEGEGEINVGRTGCQAVCELASLFLTEIAARPLSLDTDLSVPPSYILENVKSKFPELDQQAEKLYAKHLKKWQNGKDQDELNEMLKRKDKKQVNTFQDQTDIPQKQGSSCKQGRIQTRSKKK